MRTNRIHPNLFLKASLAVALAACLGSGAFAQDKSSSSKQGLEADHALQAAVVSALAQDAVLQNQHVKAAAADGIVVLSGTVETDQQRQEAETVAANVPGVSGIQNNIKVTNPGSQAQTPPPPPEGNPAPSEDQGSQEMPPPPPDASPEPAQPQSSQQMPPPPPPDQPQSTRRPTYPSYPPQRNSQGYGSYAPQPVSGPVTIPAGTLLQVRTSEPLDLSKIQEGTIFQTTAASDVYEGNVLAIPRGAVLQGQVVHVKRAGNLSGKGELQLAISSINLGGRVYPVATDLWSSAGPSKTGYTASNTAAGAVVGAIIGGIVGRGPGAAAGAIVGGGAGMAASAATDGPRSFLPPESLLNFHLTDAVTVQPVSWQEAQRLAQSTPQLQRRPVYMAPRYRYAYPYPYPYPYPYAYAYPYPYYRVYGW